MKIILRYRKSGGYWVCLVRIGAWLFLYLTDNFSLPPQERDLQPWCVGVRVCIDASKDKNGL